MPNPEHAFVGADWQIHKAVVIGKPAFQSQNMPMGMKSGKLTKRLIADDTGA